MNKSKLCKKHNLKIYYQCHKEYFTDNLRIILESPDDYCKTDILKEDNTFTTTVATVIVDSNKYTIKRYNIKSFKHALKRALVPSRASRCWHYANLLQNLGINTPQPIAMIEKRWGPFRRQAYYLSKYIDGPDGFEVFRDNPASEAITKERAINTINLLEKLRQHNLYHGDLKASNFIYNGATPYIIDLDAMSVCHRFNKKRKLEKDKNRFLLNWVKLDCMDYFSEWIREN